MSSPLVFGCFWVLAATATALLPMKWQMLPGLGLLIAAPVLLTWIGWVHGWVWLAFGIFAFVSMFRRPLIHLTRLALGRPTVIPGRDEP